MTERYSSVAEVEVEAALGKVVSLAGYRDLLGGASGGARSGGKRGQGREWVRSERAATDRDCLAFLERDSGFEPPTFSLGTRKGPFRAVTGGAK